MRQPLRGVRLARFILIATFLILPATPRPATQAQAASRYFSETGHTLRGAFLAYWTGHGGLAQQGYPLTEEFQETNKLNGKSYTVQYFERAVFELHPENAPPYDVLLSQLGTFRYNHLYPQGAPGQQRNQQTPHLFPETGHVVGGRFRTYWEGHGGLAQFGYPLSEEFREVSPLNGQPYTVQYFERAVLEAHPENAPPYNVLLSQLGKFELDGRYPNGSNPASARVSAPAGLSIPAACQDIPGDTSLCMVSEAGDYIGAGRTTILTTNDATFGARLGTGLEVYVQASDSWTLDFAAPSGSALHPGLYTNATRYPFQKPEAAGLSIGGAGRGCNESSGQFQILDLVVDPATQQVSQLAAIFEQHCEGGAPALRGVIRIHSNVGRNGPPLPLPPTPTPVAPRINAACAAVPGDTSLCMGGDAGDFISGGQLILLTTNDAQFHGTYGDGVQISIQGSAEWTLDFTAPQGETLAVGSYDRAERAPFHSPRRPGIDISGDGRGCNTIAGRFQVLDLDYDATTGTLNRFAANFEQHCEEGAAALVGTIRYHSNAGRQGPPPPLPPTPTPVAPQLNPACADAPGDTSFCAGGTSGDFVSGGQLTILTTNDAEFSGTYNGGVQISVQAGADNSWSLDFVPPQGQELAVGLYDRAERAPFHSPSRPGLEITGGGGCNTITGRFQILALDYDPASHMLNHFAATFEQHCEGGAAALVGTIRYHSNAGRQGPPPPLPPTPTPVAPHASSFCAGNPSLQNTPTFLCLDSQPGDYVGQGRTQVLLPPAVTFTSRLESGGIAIFANDPGAPGVFWNLSFVPPEGSQLGPGLYDRAERAPFHSPLRPGLEIEGEGSGCNTLTGRFQVLEFAYDYASGEVQHFAANFEQHCEGGSAALLGEVRYQSTIGP